MEREGKGVLSADGERIAAEARARRGPRIVDNEPREDGRAGRASSCACWLTWTRSRPISRA